MYTHFLANMTESRIFQVLVILLIMDMIFGSLRAIREKRFNSSVGIDGVIRKVGMMLAVVCLSVMDHVMPMNLIGFIPKQALQVLPIKSVTIMEFFALFFCIYECLSVLKNMALSGLPVKPIWSKLRQWMYDNTGEIGKEVIEEKEKEEEDGEKNH
jgi:toxin secretion/phage lysis holin